MRNARRERELRALVRVAPEEGCFNLAEYISAHGAELGLDAEELNGPDEVLAPRLLAHVERRREEERRLAERAVLSTVRELQLGARWRSRQVALPPAPFFRLAAATIGKKYIRLVGDGVDVAVSRQLLYRAAAALRVFRDVSVNVDHEGVHLQWEGRGRLNLYSRRAGPDAFVIALPARPVSSPLPVLIGEVLAEMGFGS